MQAYISPIDDTGLTLSYLEAGLRTNLPGSKRPAASSVLTTSRNRVEAPRKFCSMAWRLGSKI